MNKYLKNVIDKNSQASLAFLQKKLYIGAGDPRATLDVLLLLGERLRERVIKSPKANIVAILSAAFALFDLRSKQLSLDRAKIRFALLSLNRCFNLPRSGMWITLLGCISR